MSFTFSNPVGSNIVSYDENSTVTVFDGEGSGTGTITYLLSGADQSLFSIDPATGVITFKGSPNFESPTDAGGDNIYDIKITAFDSGDTTIATKDVTITVQDVNEAPTAVVITEEAGPLAGLDETTDTSLGIKYATFAVTDDALGSETYTLTGADATLFEILNGNEIWLKAGAVLDFESNPTLDVGVSVKDNTLGSSVAVTDSASFSVKDVAPKMAALGATINENTAFVGNVVDTSGDTSNITYSISNVDDGALFSVDANGNLSFISAPNHENPLDVGANNTYSVTVVASASLTQSTGKTYTFTVNNLDDTSPTITTKNSFSVDEGGTTAFTVAATDPDTLPAGVTYSITGGSDAGDFDIDPNTGVVTFKATTDHENAADSNIDNVYNLEVSASDGTNTVTKQNVTVTVTDLNDNSPVISSAATASVSENQTSAYTIVATDADATSTVSYSISGTDAAFFNVDSGTGVVTFKSNPNFEAKADASGDNVYDITVKASDGTNSSSQAVAITVTDVNDVAPVITVASNTDVNENTGTSIVVVDANATDTETVGGPTVFTLEGPDATKFTIDSSTGEIKFASVPDFEAPADGGANNVYNITVKASDGINSSTEAITVTVKDQNDSTPVITSSASTNFVEGGIGTVLDVNHSDVDTVNGTTVYAISGGADAALFSINSLTGVITFVTPPDFEAPGDAGPNNVYNIDVTVNDGANTSSTQSITITVTDKNDTAPVVTTTSGSVAENSTATVLTVGFTDADTTNGTATYAFAGGADDALFNINSSTGAVSFKSGQDNENPGDTGGDGTYDIKVTVKDGVNTSAAKDITVTLNDTAPKLLTALNNVAENTTLVGSVVDTLGDTTGITYGITNADDGALFTINSAGVLSFIAPPDFENPGDVGKDNSYSVTVTASDGSTLTQQVFTFNVTDAAAPTINGNGNANTLNGTSEGETINGLGGNDTINGLDGNDTIDGGSGSDKMNGGKGNDTYIANQTHTSDIVTEAAGEGTDTVLAGANFTLGANVENLTLTGTANLTGTGNGENNVITGNSGVNILRGQGGNDTIIGGLGRDTLTGGLGDDTFVFNSKTESQVSPNHDTITDFETNVGDNDTIDLSAIVGVNLVGGASAVAVANSVTWSLSGGNTLIKIETTGDAIADMEILLTGNKLAVLDVGDFIV